MFHEPMNSKSRSTDKVIQLQRSGAYAILTLLNSNNNDFIGPLKSRHIIVVRSNEPAIFMMKTMMILFGLPAS